MTEASGSSAPGTNPPTPSTVLVVDHDEAVTAFYTVFLRDEGYAVKIARDGPSAMLSIAETLPDVVLLDAMVAGVDGFEICRRLKSEPATRLIPIILVTPLSSKA